jgi:hypothetical protein
MASKLKQKNLLRIFNVHFALLNKTNVISSMCSACPNLVDLNCLHSVTECIIYSVKIGKKYFVFCQVSSWRNEPKICSKFLELMWVVKRNIWVKIAHDRFEYSYVTNVAGNIKFYQNVSYESKDTQCSRWCRIMLSQVLVKWMQRTQNSTARKLYRFEIQT